MSALRRYPIPTYPDVTCCMSSVPVVCEQQVMNELQYAPTASECYCLHLCMGMQGIHMYGLKVLGCMGLLGNPYTHCMGGITYLLG